MKFHMNLDQGFPQSLSFFYYWQIYPCFLKGKNYQFDCRGTIIGRFSTWSEVISAKFKVAFPPSAFFSRNYKILNSFQCPENNFWILKCYISSWEKVKDCFTSLHGSLASFAFPRMQWVASTWYLCFELLDSNLIEGQQKLFDKILGSPMTLLNLLLTFFISWQLNHCALTFGGCGL